MSLEFESTTGSLLKDNSRKVWLLVLSLLLVLSAWLAWFLLFTIPIHKTSLSARLQTTTSPISLVAHRSGYVDTHQIEVGRKVQRQDELLRFVDELEQVEQTTIGLQISQLDEQLEWLAEEIERFQGEAVGSERLLKLKQDQTKIELTNVRQRTDIQQEIVTNLRSNNVVPRIEVLREQLLLAEMESIIDNLDATGQQYDKERELIRQQNAGQMARLNGQLALQAGDKAHLQQELKMQNRVLEEFSITAPLTGEIAEAIPLIAGAWIAEGTSLGTLLPIGDWQFVAYFEPADAYGHIQEGQSADIQIDGFPWQQYGKLPARVVQVDHEDRARQVRVELSLEDASGASIPLQHGMPATIQVLVERATPWQILLRAVGPFVQL